MKCTCTLIAIDRSKLCPADREITIAFFMAIINTDMKRTVHRLELIFNLIDLHRGIHVLRVKIEMSRGLPLVLASYVWCIKQFISMPVMLVFPVIFDQSPELGTFGLPEDKSGANLGRNGKKRVFFEWFGV